MTPDYTTNDPRGWCGDPRRGAALGRPSVHVPDAPAYTGRITLRRVRLNGGGYDRLGTYFGHGAPLYWYASEDGEIDAMIRANDREHARTQVLASYPHAKVRRGQQNAAVDAMVDGYLKCALWSSVDTTDDGDEIQYDNYPMTRSTRTVLVHDLRSFVAAVDAAGIPWHDHWAPSEFGHDFWLTRNHHGAGFWDRYHSGKLAEIGQRLTKIADTFGECDLYVGADRKVHV